MPLDIPSTGGFSLMRSLLIGIAFLSLSVFSGAVDGHTADKSYTKHIGMADYKQCAARINANSIDIEFVLIPAGEFIMGSYDTDKEAKDDEKPAHKVKISKPFYMGKYEVTQAQWVKVMRRNPSHFKDHNGPVERVMWDDVQAFISRLNKQEGHNCYRLPSEAEWEYAARAGTVSRYSFGDDADNLGNYAWYYDNAKKKAHPVGQKEPNPWGLMTCMGMSRNGCRIGMEKITTATARHQTRAGRH
jgi:formylglycine-generating enzyme required for sulfatase activity